MLTCSEFILFRVVVVPLGYFILVFFLTCFYTFLSRTSRIWDGVMQGLCEVGEGGMEALDEWCENILEHMQDL